MTPHGSWNQAPSQAQVTVLGPAYGAIQARGVAIVVTSFTALRYAYICGCEVAEPEEAELEEAGRWTGIRARRAHEGQASES